VSRPAAAAFDKRLMAEAVLWRWRCCSGCRPAEGGRRASPDEFRHGYCPYILIVDGTVHPFRAAARPAGPKI
jgi:hypothetical protein